VVAFSCAGSAVDARPPASFTGVAVSFLLSILAQAEHRHRCESLCRGRVRSRLSGRRESSTLVCGSLGIGLLLGELGEHDSVLILEVLLLGGTCLLAGQHGTLSLEPLWGDEALDGRGLERVLLAFLADLTLDDVLSDVVLLGEVKELSDLGSTLDTESTWPGGRFVCESLDWRIAHLDNHERQDRELSIDDAASDGLSLTLAGPSWSEARVALGHHQGDTLVGQDTLLHWETLLVVTTRDSDNVSLPCVAESVGWHFVGDPLVVKRPEQELIVDVERLLGPGGRVRNVALLPEPSF